MKDFLDLISRDGALCEAFDKALGTRHLNITGLAEEQKAFIILALAKRANLKPLIITPDPAKARAIAEAAAAFSDGEIATLNPSELSLLPTAASSKDNDFNAVSSCIKILTGDCDIAIVSAGALLNRLPTPENLKARIPALKKDGTCDMDELCKKLLSNGYERVDQVTVPGEFAKRGDILDVFVPGHTTPARIDFFDDEIERIKTFDIETQRSTDEIKELKIIPTVMFTFDGESGVKASQTVLECARADISKMNIQSAAGKVAKILTKTAEDDASRLGKGLPITGIARWLGVITDETSTILDYADACGKWLIFVDEFPQCDSRMRTYSTEYLSRCNESFEVGMAPSAASLAIFDIAKINRNLDMSHNAVTLSVLGGGFAGGAKCQVTGFAAENVFGREKDFAQTLSEDAKRAGKTVFVMLSGKKRIDAFRDTMKEFDCFPDVIDRALPAGFVYPALNVSFYGGAEIFGVAKKHRKTSALSPNRIKFFSDIKPGDYVVHDDFGIGRYEGLTNLKIGKFHKDYLKICYDGEQVIYVLPEDISILQKYIGPAGRPPKLSHIGGKEWTRSKEKAAKTVKKIAYDLLKLYAARSVNKGFAALPDGEEQKQFEASFPYVETDDQLSAIADIKHDMESTRPMDRLLCGDVGFGKTEVAFRAIFKSVMSGGQAMLLAPTTLLALQHYNNLIGRLGPNSPVTVVLLCRFVPQKQIKENLEKIENGTADVIIGTHRILSDDVKPKNLELLVVDEEQRFGVNHKEKIKAAKSKVDVLTLTATPIPRTLHMSLSGIRDISVLEEPPFNRRAVQTYVTEYNPEIVVQACLREIARGGQIFYLHNKVSDIDRVADELSKTLPGVRITYAHGQMNERQLEDTVKDFIDGKYDILVCTTIIENGVDMPNVNTLIVDGAEHFGLSQLYQIKGRVGRSDRQAYAYITYSAEAIVNETARKRLEALREFTELGSGLKIAMRDLEVRGAGNILGAEQHGQMDAIGYELYSRMLDEEIKLLKAEGDETIEVKENNVSVNMEGDAYIPSSYVPEETGRMVLYRKIADISSEDEYKDFMEEITDRYGTPPPQIQTLAGIAVIRHMCDKAGFIKADIKPAAVALFYDPKKQINMDALSVLMADEFFASRIRITTDDGPALNFKPASLKTAETIKDTIRLLHICATAE